jgi:membrane protein DedA with SNARE-associated domain
MVYNLLVSLPIAGHLILAAYIARKIGISIILTKKQKLLNIILVVLIPFVWSVLMYYILKKEPNYFDKRKRITNDSLDNGALYISNQDTGSGHF